MSFDAVVLAGGRSSRLGGEPKAALVYEGETLLARTLDAAADARLTVVVGDLPSGLEITAETLSAREDPPFGGPAAGVAAGVDELARASAAVAGTSDSPERADFLLVLGCDMPRVGDAVRVLLASAPELMGDGVVAIDDSGRPQHLVGLYRAAALRAAVDAHRGALDNLSVRALLSAMSLGTVPVPPSSTQDIDTWADAAQYGIIRKPLITHEAGRDDD